MPPTKRLVKDGPQDRALSQDGDRSLSPEERRNGRASRTCRRARPSSNRRTDQPQAIFHGDRQLPRSRSCPAAHLQILDPCRSKRHRAPPSNTMCARPERTGGTQVLRASARCWCGRTKTLEPLLGRGGASRLIGDSPTRIGKHDARLPGHVGPDVPAVRAVK